MSKMVCLRWNINKPILSINEGSAQIWSCFRLPQLLPVCHSVPRLGSRPVAFVLSKRHRSEKLYIHACHSLN